MLFLWVLLGYIVIGFIFDKIVEMPFFDDMRDHERHMKEKAKLLAEREYDKAAELQRKYDELIGEEGRENIELVELLDTYFTREFGKKIVRLAVILMWPVIAFKMLTGSSIVVMRK